MSTQPEALRLAEQLEAIGLHGPVAAELRRLHAENEELWKEREEPHKTIEMYVSECNRLERERDALLKALLRHMGMDEDEWNKPTFDHARAAIKAVEEQK